MAEKKYYWLKLKEDFFEEDTLAWIEEQEKGKEYCLFYLKLCLKSLKNEGVLIRNVGQMLIPYDAKKLAELTKTDLDTVIVAMELFKKTGLVQVLDNGEIYLTQLKKMVGSETEWAAKKRTYRKGLSTSSEDNVPKLSENKETMSDKRKSIEKDKDKEIDIDIDIEKETTTNNNDCFNVSNVKVFKHLEKCGFRLSAMQYEEIAEDIKIYTANWVMEAALEASNRGKINYSYVKGILSNWLAKGKDNAKKEGEKSGTNKKNNGTEPKDEWVGL